MTPNMRVLQPDTTMTTENGPSQPFRQGRPVYSAAPSDDGSSSFSAQTVLPLLRRMLPRWNVGSGWQYQSTTPAEKSSPRADGTGSGSGNGGYTDSPSRATFLSANHAPWDYAVDESASSKDEWLRALRGIFTRNQPSRQAFARRFSAAGPILRQLSGDVSQAADVCVFLPQHSSSVASPTEHGIHASLSSKACGELDDSLYRATLCHAVDESTRQGTRAHGSLRSIAEPPVARYEPKHSAERGNTELRRQSSSLRRATIDGSRPATLGSRDGRMTTSSNASGSQLSEASSSSSSVFTATGDVLIDNDGGTHGDDQGLGFYDEWSCSLKRFATLRRTAHYIGERSFPKVRLPESRSATCTLSPRPLKALSGYMPLSDLGDPLSTEDAKISQHKPRTPRLFRRGLQMLTERARNSFRASRSKSDHKEQTRKIKTAHSYESLLAGVPKAHSSDVREGHAQVQPLHASVLGQENCFQIVTNMGSTFYACRGAEERDRWISCLRKTINPNEDSTRRTDVSLKLWVQEAKNCQSKKRYFCEIALDKTVYARTSTKVKGEMLFWGEQFEFENLPALKTVTLTLYKESSDKRKLRQWAGGSNERGAASIGCIIIDVSNLLNRQVSEQWYTVGPLAGAPAPGGKNGRDSKLGASAAGAVPAESAPQIRVKARYQAVHVLPLASYSDLSQYVQQHYLSLVDELEPLLAVRAKDDVATVLVNILQHEGKATTFLCDIVMADVLKQENSHLMFRGNTIATKAIEAYMKLVSARYLRSTLGECVRSILDASEDCEVDPSKLAHGTNGGTVSQSVLSKHQAALVKYCEQVWAKIAGSLASFPSELRDVFAAFRGRCRDMGKPELADNLISACVFLRLLCPAIMSPSLFGLCQEFPDERASRTFTLVAKTIQSLANFTKFGAKEDYMLHMNDFVDREWARMHEYLQKISSIDSKYRRVDYEGRIDVAKHLSLLHSLLCEDAKTENGNSSSTAAAADRGASSTSELRHRLQPVLQRLTDEVEFGSDSVPVPANTVLTENAAYGILDFGSRGRADQGASNQQCERRVVPSRRRPLSSSEHVEGCVTPRDLRSAPPPPSSEGGHGCGPAAAKQKDGVPDACPGVRQPRTGSDRVTATEPRVRYARRQLPEAETGLPTALHHAPSAAVGGHEPASDSAYDTLRSTGSQSSAGGGGAHSDGGGAQSDSSGRQKEVLRGTGSGASTKKVMLHKVWDRVLTANDLITGDYVDLISYVDDSINGSRNDSNCNVTTTTTAAALLASHSSASREGSLSVDSGAPGASVGTVSISADSLSRKGGAAAPTTPSRQAPLTFFNPAFRVGTNQQSAATEPSATLPFSRSFPGRSGGDGAEGSNVVIVSAGQWLPSDRFASLNHRASQEVSGSAEPHKTLLAPHNSTGSVPVGIPQHPVPMARRSTSSGGSSHGKFDAGATTPREGHISAEMYTPQRGAQPAPVTGALPRPGSYIADTVHPVFTLAAGESSTWSRGVSATQNALREEWSPSGAGTGHHHSSQLDVQAKGAHYDTLVADGSRTLPAPRRAASNDPAERENVELLKQQVEEAQRRLADTEQRLAQHTEMTNRTIQEWRQRLEASEESLRMQTRAKDEQIECIIQRLMTIEDDLRKEQRDMKDAISERQHLVELQEKKIQLLNETNSDLIDSLRVLREQVGRQVSPPPTVTLVVASPAELQLPLSSPLLAASAAASPAADEAKQDSSKLYKTMLYYNHGSTSC